MKFCKDCKWVNKKDAGSWDCTHDKKREVNVITGEREFLYCAEARSITSLCGPTAKWFEEKEKPVPSCYECRWFCEIGSSCDAVMFRHFITRRIGGVRLDESLCGKYGKWWEKKLEYQPTEVSSSFTIALQDQQNVKRNTLVGMARNTKPKQQSWLCRLICGRKK